MNLSVLPDWKGSGQNRDQAGELQPPRWAVGSAAGRGTSGWAQQQEGDAAANKAEGVRSTSTLPRYQLVTSNENIFPLGRFPDFQRQEGRALGQQHRYYG